MASEDGHVFLVWSDLNRLSCDAWLLPTDSHFHVVRAYWDLADHPLPEPPQAWLAKEVRSLPVPGWPAGSPCPYLTNVVAPDLTTTVNAAVEFVERASHDLATGALQRTTTRRSKPLLGVPLVGTGHGGKRRAAGEVVRALLPELTRAAERSRVDVALVLYDEVEYAAAQAARESSPSLWPGLDDAQREHATALAERARTGQLVLFMGAGVSVPAGGPTWRELIARLAERAALDADERAALDKLGPLDAARVVEDRLALHGERIHDVVKTLVPNQRFSLTHALLAGLRVREAVTTNYDQLYEKACARPHGAEPASLPVDASKTARSWVLKMHGSFAAGDDIVLTRTDYLRYETRRAALAGIVQALLMTRHMLFIGYSLQDETFLRMVDAVRRAVAGPREGPAVEPLGSVLALSDDRFFHVLWKGELDSVGFGADPDSPEALSRASRQQEIFLDCLSSQASGTSRFLLDPRFSEVLTPADQELATILADTREKLLASDAARASRAWPAVWELFSALGARERE